VSITLGLFDVFTYLIPGSLYLALASYVADRFGWIDVGHFRNVSSLVLLGAILIASYLLAFVADPLAALLEKVMRFLRVIHQEDVTETFKARVPGAADRAFVTASPYLLLALAETNHREAAMEISRFRATGLMLRNCSIPFLAACIVSIAQAIAGPRSGPAIICAILFAAAVWSSIRQGKRLREWAVMKTLEICYWIPGIDDMVLGGKPKR